MAQAKIFIPFFHGLVLLLAYTSPLFLSWRLVSVGAFMFGLQRLVLGGCVLTKAQFGTYKQNFHYWILTRLGFRPKKRLVELFTNYIAPPLLILSAFLLG